MKYVSEKLNAEFDTLATSLCARFAGATTVPKLATLCELPLDDTLELPAIA